MKRSLSLSGFLLASMIAGCGSSPPPDPAPPAPTPAPTTNSMTAPPVETAKAPEPTPEEKKKAEALKELEKDRAKLRADTEAEKARWTPELKAEAKALTEKAFPSGKDAIKAIATSKVRHPGFGERDKYRHPVETLDVFGFTPTMTVLDYGPGEGWYTELLAPALAKKGKYLATNGDPNGPPELRSTFYAERFKAILDSSPELYGKAETVLLDGKTPALPGQDGKIDMVIVMRGLHNMVNNKKLDDWLAAFHTSLKPNGILGIEEHRALPDANPEDAAKKGYLPEKWTIEKIEAAGFKLAKKSEINANPKDTKDYADGVWTLPPNLRLGDKDREKYTAIGESDRMTLKFVKVAKKAPAPTTATAPATKPATPAPATPAKK